MKFSCHVLIATRHTCLHFSSNRSYRTAGLHMSRINGKQDSSSHSHPSLAQKHNHEKQGSNSPRNGDKSESSSILTLSTASSSSSTSKEPPHHQSPSKFIRFWNEQTSSNFYVSWQNDGKTIFMANIKKGAGFEPVYRSNGYKFDSREDELTVMREADTGLVKACRKYNVTIGSDPFFIKLAAKAGLSWLLAS